VCRGFAALLVLLYHTSQITEKYFGRPYDAGLFSFGYAGVDFFFVLSGFIIMYVHGNDFGHRARLTTYLGKRFVRVYPAYWVVTLPLLAIYALRPDLGRGIETSPWSIFSSFLLLPGREKPILDVAWTLCHEIKFYLIFALGILVGWKVAKRIFFGIMTVSAAVFLAHPLGRGPDTTSPLFGFIFSPYNLEFAFGCFGAWMLFTAPPRKPTFILAIGLIGFATAAFFQRDTPPLAATYSILMFGFASGLVVLGAAAREIRAAVAAGNRTYPTEPLVPAKASHSPFRFLGNASYSIYLTHTVVLSALAKVCVRLEFHEAVGLFGAGAFMAVGALASGCLFHVLVERRLLAWTAHRVASKRAMPDARIRAQQTTNQ
jgi:exopolysaccharide production protein ExoZ